MTDEFEKLEARLSAIRPLAVSQHLREQIEAELNSSAAKRMSFADRCLAITMSAGALAACVIVGLTLWETIDRASPVPSGPLPQLAQQTTANLGQYQQAIARASDSWSDILK